MADEVTRDTLLGGAVTLLQPRRGHRAGTDAVLLASLAEAQDGDAVVDLGSASGAAKVASRSTTWMGAPPWSWSTCSPHVGSARPPG